MEEGEEEKGKDGVREVIHLNQPVSVQGEDMSIFYFSSVLILAYSMVFEQSFCVEHGVPRSYEG